jgi:hypothetical protein
VSSPPSRGVTAKSLGIGALLSLIIGTAVPYTNMIINGTLMAHNFSTPAALFLFLLLILGVNVLLRWLVPGIALRRAELAVVYIMAMLATSVPTVGFTENLLPIISGLYYYATPENNWAELIHPHVPSWLAPQDPAAIRHFYEGLPEGLTVPWGAWGMPLLAWTIFILAFYWVCLCSMVILRKQWVEHEKLVYPLVQLPLEMIRDADQPGRLVPPFFRKGVMWAGFAIPFAIGMVNGLHSYFEFVPQIILFGEMPMFRDSVILRFDVNLALIGFAYLINRDVAAGFWLFFLLSFVQRGVFGMLGVASTENLSRFANLVGPFMAHQAMGAMIVLILSGLWMARGHLRDVFAKAFGRAEEVDDTDEMLSYRAAVRGLLASLAVVCVWLGLSGFPWWVVPIFLFAVLVVFTAVTRAVVEGGVSFIRSPLTPADFVISGLGTPALGASGLIGIAFTYVWASNIRIFFLPCIANALKLSDEVRGERRKLLWAVGIAILIALGGSIWSVMSLSYQYGGINLHVFWFVFVPQKAFGYIAPKFATPEFIDFAGWAYTSLGAGLMALFTFLRYRFLWWPIHPLGFATGTFFIMNWVWFSIFIAWLVKTAILKYSGPTGFRQTRPFFLGLVLGHTTIAGVWLLIDACTGMNGNVVGFF